MKEKILQIAKWLEKGEMNENAAKTALLNLFDVVMRGEQLPTDRDKIESLIKHLEQKFEDWKIESVDRYYYASGRNYWTYKEVTYWYEARTMERKESIRQETISTGGEWNLPEWAKGITSRRKSLELDF